MITIRQYAETRKISYEAARQQVNRLRDELEGHIVKEGRTQYLDDLAVQILDERRPKHAVIVQDAADESQELKDLRARNEALLLKVTDLQEQLISKQEMIIQLQDQLRALEGSSTPPAAPAEDPPQAAGDPLDDPAPTPENVETVEIQPAKIQPENKPKSLWQRILDALRG